GLSERRRDRQHGHVRRPRHRRQLLLHLQRAPRAAAVHAPRRELRPELAQADRHQRIAAPARPPQGSAGIPSGREDRRAAALADPGGPHVLRARAMAAFAAAALLITGLGTVASTRPALAIVLLFAFAVAASLARVGGEAAGAVGTTSLILLCIALGSPAPPEQ